MEDPATDYNICGCCGTEFKFSGQDFDELRRRWVENGIMWRRLERYHGLASR